MQEPPELAARVRKCVQRLEAVDHDEPGLTLPERTGDLLANARQPAGAQRRPKILIEHGAADRRPVEEVQGLAEPDNFFQRLGDRREIERRAIRPGVPEDVLLRDDRLAGPGQAHDEADRVLGQPSAQHRVQGLVTAEQPARHRAASGLGRRNALAPRRSRTVETSCNGSSGFNRNASAPASIARSRASSTDTAMTRASPCSLKYWQRLSPVPPEMSNSTTTTDGEHSVKDFWASAAVRVTSTSNPSVFRKYSSYSAA